MTILELVLISYVGGLIIWSVFVSIVFKFAKNEMKDSWGDLYPETVARIPFLLLVYPIHILILIASCVKEKIMYLRYKWYYAKWKGNENREKEKK